MSNQDPAFLRAASVLVGEGVDLSALPRCPAKTEFFELAHLALDGRLRSLGKARLEVLSEQLAQMWEHHVQQDAIDKHKAEAQALRDKRDKMRKMLKKKTRKGQPVLKNLAKVQLLQIQEILDKERKDEQK
jgi:hypothetical protein